MTIKIFLLAVASAVLIMIVNVAISFGVVAGYAYTVDPGHDAAYYERAAQWIAPWSSIAFGWLLFLLVTFMATRRSWVSNALGFAFGVFAVYAAMDLGILAAVGDLAAIGPVVSVSLTSKMAGAIAGVYLAERFQT
ncbi:MAG: hypothetical protein ABL973_03200 [Micropepsaceae bacterium]